MGAGVLVLLFGVARLFGRRHPRWLVRVRPSQLLLWSFLMATAHGAALMLLPIFIGLCAAPVAAGPAGIFDHENVMALMRTNLGTAVLVSLVHSAAMIVAGLGLAWLVYRSLGLRVLRSTWFDLDRVWAASLIAAGIAAVAMAG
jgi:hypothetical protein